MIGIREIEEARARIDDFVIRTPCPRSETFSALCGARTWFKLENLQMTGSFKERGALNRILSLTPEERARGVIAASAGNHAQGVAYHAGRLGIPATIVMPDRTPLIKVANTRRFGAKVVLAGGNFDEAYAVARRLQEEENLVFVHPFDDDSIIAGQGTIGLELLEQIPDLEVAIVPIGGGGLISGVAVALKETRPRIRVIGVQTAAFPSMKASVDASEPVTVAAGRTIADGIAVKRPGGKTLEYVRRYVDEVVTVDEEEIANAILLLLEREKTVVEGAGAVPLAALLNRRCSGTEGRNVAMLLSGGNIDVNLISRIIERGLVKDGRMVRLMVRIEDRPGSLARLTALVAEQAANIIEIHHDRAFGKSGYGETEVSLTLETRGRDHVEQLTQALDRAGYRISEL
ncbi:threonine ammonia-lyase [Vulgatibacter incomptus]|uniref:Threonine dehydratase n=1 Tax=Vulgatibacter incomptus TaxID=1391653 RepID=A0A0K1PDA0_9BACT|nr:threonine ammonia-lyase [Vulgatibacter incomptus]AKU91477.1 Threonine dehydratase [Vulgatibacter incomptus]